MTKIFLVVYYFIKLNQFIALIRNGIPQAPLCLICTRWVMAAFSDLETGSSSSRLSMEPVEEGSCYFPRINGALKPRYKAKDPDLAQNENRWIHVFSVEKCKPCRKVSNADHADLKGTVRGSFSFLDPTWFYLALPRSSTPSIINSINLQLLLVNYGSIEGHKSSNNNKINIINEKNSNYNKFVNHKYFFTINYIFYVINNDNNNYYFLQL